MNKLALTVATVLLATGVLAQESRPLTTTLSCRHTSNAITSQGSMVLQTGANTYDRYVSWDQFCQRGERAEPAWVPTADVKQCFIGYRCLSGRKNER